MGPEMYQTGVDVDTSVDEVIYNLIEIRNANRPDLPRLINPLKGGLAVVPPPNPNIPPKRGRCRPPKHPRVISNVQVRPPRPGFVTERVGRDSGEASTPVVEEGSEAQGWTAVSGRRRRRRRLRSRATSSISRQTGLEVGTLPKKKDPNVVRKRRLAKTAAITVTGATKGFSYAEALTEVRGKVPLDEMEIEKMTMRRTTNGGRIFEISESDAVEKADLLAGKIRKILGAEARVARPFVKGEMRVIGLDDSVTSEEVATKISQLGPCDRTLVKVGAICVMRNGLGTVWVQCPLAVANKVAGRKKISIGLTVAKVELLASRPTQCYKCWEYGHTRPRCNSTRDLTGIRFRCGGRGHTANSCVGPVKCPPCELDGATCDHRFGSLVCKYKPGGAIAARGGIARKAGDTEPTNNDEVPPSEHK